MTALRIGLLSAARIAPNALLKPAGVLPSVEISACAARDPERAQAFADKWDIPKVAPDYQALLNDPDIDLIYNPLPINLHAEWTIRALEAGKHVLCEKPFAMNAGEAEAMLATSQRTGKRLFEAFHYRYHPAFLTCLDWLRSGAIGEIQSLDAAFDLTIPFSPNEIRHQVETGGGAMMDLGCYCLSWVLAVLDDTPNHIDAEAVLTKAGIDETMSAAFRFKSGVTAKLHSTMAKPGPGRTIFLNIEGSQGRIAFENPLVPHSGGRLTLENAEGKQEAEVSAITTYTWQLAAVARALNTGAPTPMEGAALLRQQSVLDAIYDAAGLGHLRSV